MTLYAIIALVEVDDSIGHDAIYSLPLLKAPGVREIYMDVDPEWRSFPVLADNAIIPDRDESADDDLRLIRKYNDDSEDES